MSIDDLSREWSGIWRSGNARFERMLAFGKRPSLLGVARAGSIVSLIVISLLPISVLVRLAVAMVVCAVVFVANDVRRTRASRTYERDIVEAFGELAIALHSGAGLYEGLVAVAEQDRSCAADLRRLLTMMQAGATLAESVDHWRRNRPSVAVNTVGTALLLTLESGGSPVRAVESASSVARDVLEAQSIISTHVAHATTSMWVLTVLPIAVMCGIIGVDDAARHFMLHTGAGGAAILSGVTLDLAGAFLMARMVRAAV